MNTRIVAACTLVLGLIAAEAAAQCDTTPPCAPAPPEVSVNLTDVVACVYWTNLLTGDDGCNPNPPATRYEIRMSTQPITAMNWSTLPITANGLIVGMSDQQHNIPVQCTTTYYFVLFIIDDADNRSAPVFLSGTSLPCGQPPSFCDQELLSEDYVAPCAPADPTIEVATHTAYLQWNNDSSGDDGCDGLPHKWEIRQSTSPINSSNYLRAPIKCKSTVATPSFQGYNITDLTCNTTYYWALYFFDEMGNRSGAVYRSGTTLSCSQSLEVTGEFDFGLPCCNCCSF